MNVLNFFDPDRWVPRKDESPLEYWMSLSPAASMFGVAWRFDDPAGPAGRRSASGPPCDTQGQHQSGGRKAEGPAREASAESSAMGYTTGRAVEAETGSAPSATPGPAEPVTDADRLQDDLKRIKGIGAKLEAELNALGIVRFGQIADLGPKDLQRLDERLSGVRGRPQRDDWQGQASVLARG